MVDFSDGWFMLPLRVVQLANSLIVLVCAIAGRVNLPGFVSAIHAQDIILVASIIQASTTVILMFMFYVFKAGGKVAVVTATVFSEFMNYGLAIAGFINLMYDFKNQPAGMLDQVCTVDTTMKNPNPILGCQFYQAAVAFMAVSWFLWTISMTWIISQIHKRVRKAQMAKFNPVSKQKEALREMESQASNYTARYPYTNSPVHEMPTTRLNVGGSTSRPLSSIFSNYGSASRSGRI